MRVVALRERFGRFASFDEWPLLSRLSRAGRAFIEAISDDAPHGSLLSRYYYISAESRRLRAEAQRAAQSLRDEASGNIQFGHLDSTTEDSVLIELKDLERVHEVGSIDELRSYRVGDQDSNKRVFARRLPPTDNVTEEEQLLAAMYTARYVVSHDEDQLPHDRIPGNINVVKNDLVRLFEAPSPGSRNETVVVVLYSISSHPDHDWDKGAGRRLADYVYETLTQEAEDGRYNLVVSTLSPVRDFYPWFAALPAYKEYEFYNKDEKCMNENFMKRLKADPKFQQEVRVNLLTYLMLQGDNVCNFHCGNGAFIADLNLNFDNPQDPVMINYKYAGRKEALRANREFHAETGKCLMAPELFWEALDFNAYLPKSGKALINEDDMPADLAPQSTKVPAQVEAVI